MRSACCVCHVPLDGGGAITDDHGLSVSHGLCDSCGGEEYGDLWCGRVGVTRWPSSRLAEARSLAAHSTYRLARLIGTTRSAIRWAETRERLTRRVQLALCDAPAVYAYYDALTGGKDDENERVQCRDDG